MTNHFIIKKDPTTGLFYTQASFIRWHQKSIEIREKLLFKMVNLTVPVYKWVGKPKVSDWEIELADLAQFPEGTLGKAWYRFYQHADFGITPHYETHDISHVLLGYKTTIVEETRMYSFLFGSGKISLPTLLTIFIGVICLPEFIPYFYQDYQLGKTAQNIAKWDFRYLLKEDLNLLRKMVFQQKICY